MSSSHHSFDIALATQLGSIELAIVLHHFQYWINHNQKLDKNFKDGRTWMYQTREEIAAHFPYFSGSMVRRYTDRLVKLGILKKDNFNKKGFDKTLWYAFENEEKFTIGKFAKSIGKNAKPIPKSLPSSLTKDIRDLGQKMTLAVHKDEDKTLDLAKRWVLNEEHMESFRFLKKCEIDATDEKLCFWAKAYPIQRLIDVFNEAKHNKARSLRKYMGKLLDEKKVVFNARIEANSSFAKDFVRQNGWHSPKIFQKYMKIPIGNDFTEISFDMDSKDFLVRLLEKYENNEEKYG